MSRISRGPSGVCSTHTACRWMPCLRRAAANSAFRGPAISATAARHAANRSGGMGLVMAIDTTRTTQAHTHRHHSSRFRGTPWSQIVINW